LAIVLEFAGYVDTIELAAKVTPKASGRRVRQDGISDFVSVGCSALNMDSGKGRDKQVRQKINAQVFIRAVARAAGRARKQTAKQSVAQPGKRLVDLRQEFVWVKRLEPNLALMLRPEPSDDVVVPNNGCDENRNLRERCTNVGQYL
jgi:hypothetical protein